MPTMHNGIGTWYYGKSKIHRRVDYCAHCNRAGELQSYDTTLYFVVFFVPVIPLGGKRILEQCPSCRRHHAVSMKHWLRNRDAALADATDRLKANPTDPQTIKAAIVASVQFQDETLLDDTLSAIAGAPDLGAPELLSLADAFSFFSRWTEAERACQAALDREDTPQGRRKLALILLKLGRPAEAEPLLEPILKEGLREQVGLVDLLIQGYQGQGLHTQALAVMDRADQAFPELVKEKTWKSRRKLSVRHENTGKKIASGYLTESGKVGTSAGGWTSRLPRIIFPTLVVGALGVYLSAALWMGGHRKVFLVNGAPKAYAVNVNGIEQKLNPGQVKPIWVPEGELTAQVFDPRFPSEPMVCRIATPFFSRPFVHKTFVLNPDQSAILLWEGTEYVLRGKDQPEVQSDIHVGKLLHEFANLNYEFAPFPQVLTVKSNQSVKKTRVDVLPGLNGLPRLQLAMSNLDDAGQLAYARRRLALDPGDVWTLGWFVSRVPAEEALALLRPGLGDRPINVEWHRYYQELMEEAYPDHNLAPEYAKLAAESGRSPDTLYLLARVSEHQEGAKLLEEAAKGQAPSVYALASLGFRNLAAGRFKEAVAYLSKASPVVAHDSRDNLTYVSALQAAGAHDQLRGRLQQLEQVPGFYRFARCFRVKDLAARGDQKGAGELIEQTRVQNAKNPRMEQFFLQMEAARSCALNDVAGYLKTVSVDEAKSSFCVSLLLGKLRAAAENVQKDSRVHEAMQHGLLYLYASKKNDSEMAKVQWSRMIAILERGNRDQRELAKFMAGGTPPDLAWLTDLPLDPEHKRVFLLAVAQRFPTADKNTAALARRLDFQRDEISLCLKNLSKQ